MGLGSIRLEVLENWTAGFMGRLYLRSSCAPADYACLDAAGAEGSAASPKLAPLSAQYRTIRDARPWSPTQLTTHPFHYRTLRIPPVPQRASQGLARGGRCIETTTCLTSALHSSAAVRVNALTCARWGRVPIHRLRLSVKGWLLSPSNKLEAPGSRLRPTVAPQR